MVCYNPLQVAFSEDPTTRKKQLDFLSRVGYDARKAFESGSKLLFANVLRLPCGRCIGCRLDKSRQWAVRCMHEAALHDDNCFLTLTYDDEHLPAGGTLVKRDLQLFLKRLRKAHVGRVIRYYGCGEYGEQLSRPHYHLCLFNYAFPDRKIFKRGSQPLWVSDELSSLWPLGHSTIGCLSFDSAAYVARYVCKKVVGGIAASHYGDKQPEFALMSLKPGIGAGWFDKYGPEVYPSDYVVSRGFKVKPPRYYDRRLALARPQVYEEVRQRRSDAALTDDIDTSYRRLLDREACVKARCKMVKRSYEV